MTTSPATDTDTPARRSFYQRRVGVLGKVLTIVWLVGNSALALTYIAMGWWRELLTVGQALSWSALLICFAVWLVCRRGTHSRRFVSAVESASMMGSAAAVALMGRYIAPQAFKLNAETEGYDLDSPRTQGPRPDGRAATGADPRRAHARAGFRLSIASGSGAEHGASHGMDHHAGHGSAVRVCMYLTGFHWLSTARCAKPSGRTRPPPWSSTSSSGGRW